MAPFSLEEGDVETVTLESPVGDKRRIDVEVGSTVIEVKRDLRKGKIRQDAIDQLAGYVEARGEQTGLRYVGVLTDGVEWRCYHFSNSRLEEVSCFELKLGTGAVDQLTVWLEGVLATSQDIAPIASEIRSRLGAESSSHKLDRATLTALYDQHRDLPTVKLKRELWSRLLTSALGTQFDDSDELFVEHTLLVNSAEIIAHAVLGLSITNLDPRSLLLGAKFDESGIYGVVEADFFDWVIEVPQGNRFVLTLSRRLARFRWDDVEHDVLKVLYESVIGTNTRKKLGEYYTPDWLAEKIIKETVASPLSEKVLDPACGSGTFLFHAAKHFIHAAEAAGKKGPDILDELTHNVIGMDLHPVAVTFARVTYLLAIGRDRLTDANRRTIQIPVYLGDSIQWRQQIDLWSAGNLVVQTDDDQELFGSELRFPDALLENTALFDRLVDELAQKASTRKTGSSPPSLKSTFTRLGISTKYQTVIENTFKTMCQLKDEGRDHIWSYYVRNLARPMWLAKPDNRVDVVVGNPPWLAYRYMTQEMQTTFRDMSQAWGLWHGAEFATQQDLSAVFVARAIQLYLKKGGQFGLIMPNAAIDRPQYSGLREGSFEAGGELLSLQYHVPWDLRRIRPHIFPRGSCVLFGVRAESSNRMPSSAKSWTGKVPANETSWDRVKSAIDIKTVQVKLRSVGGASSYKDRFRNGATIFPRVLLFIEEQDAGPLGTPIGRIRVRSTSTAHEKLPWKELARLTGVVESETVRPVLMSDCVLPFVTTETMRAVLPLIGDQFIGPDQMKIDEYPGLAEWWRQANSLWEKYRSSERLTLSDRIDYMHNLSEQTPIPPLRVVYNKSGMHVVASKVTDKRAIVENGLYWTSASTVAEADYLCAILNSPTTTGLVRPLMAYGKDERHVAKSIWQLPIPEFDDSDPTHLELALLGSELETIAKEISIDSSLYFPATRRKFRTQLEAEPQMARTNEIVFDLLS